MGALVGDRYWDNTVQCAYDPLGALRHPCENGATDVWYDGPNPVGTTSGFTFVQGPGVDDPLVGDNPTLANAHLYYVTDGEGRQYAVGDSAGWDATNDSNPSVYQAYALAANGGKYAGGTASANGFGASRFDNAQAPGISFFRNRFYDQATGRWTQEDPLGVAGGLNLYAYVANNPAMFTDPFGLCKPHDELCRRMMGLFRSKGGEGGAMVADALDKNQVTLQPTLHPGNSAVPSTEVVQGRTDLTSAGGPTIFLRSDFMIAQQAVIVAHEFFQHIMRNRSDHPTDPHDPMLVEEARTLHALNLRGVTYLTGQPDAAEANGIHLNPQGNPEHVCARRSGVTPCN